MLGSLGLLTVPSDTEERLPRSSFPWVWLGFPFAATYFVIEIVVIATSFDSLVAGNGLEVTAGASGLLILVSIGGWIYWLVCIYQLHKILEELSPRSYPNSPGEAVGKHFIPFYNFYWIFKWPADMSDYINQRGRVKMVSGYLVGALILVGIIMRAFDGALGLAWIFATTLFLSHKLKKHVNSLKGIDPNRLPPLPDPRMFRDPGELSTVQPAGLATEPESRINPYE